MKQWRRVDMLGSFEALEISVRLCIVTADGDRLTSKPTALSSTESMPAGSQAPGASAPAAGGGDRLGAAADGGTDVLAEASFDGGFRVPGSIYNRLFDYQKTGMRIWPAPPHVQPCFPGGRLRAVLA